MQELAKHIVEQKSGHFEPETFEDHYEQALQELLNQKRKGLPIATARRPAPSNVFNLMDALKQSIESGDKAKPVTKPTKAKKAPAKRLTEINRSIHGRRLHALGQGGYLQAFTISGRLSPRPVAEPLRRLASGPISFWPPRPKWDGFRCLLIREGSRIRMQSKSGRDLVRYFPEIAAAAATLPQKTLTLDGELIIELEAGHSFDALLQRIHPRLAEETPATFRVFDLLQSGSSAARKLKVIPLPPYQRPQRYSCSRALRR